MVNLPNQDNLPIHLLAACFNKTSATYKFYWFLSILNRVEQGEVVVDKRHLFADMIAHSWFTVNYFHVSFGKQDKLQQAIEKAVAAHDSHALGEAVRSLKELLFFVEGA